MHGLRECQLTVGCTTDFADFALQTVSMICLIDHQHSFNFDHGIPPTIYCIWQFVPLSVKKIISLSTHMHPPSLECLMVDWESLLQEHSTHHSLCSRFCFSWGAITSQVQQKQQENDFMAHPYLWFCCFCAGVLFFISSDPFQQSLSRQCLSQSHVFTHQAEAMALLVLKKVVPHEIFCHLCRHSTCVKHWCKDSKFQVMWHKKWCWLILHLLAGHQSFFSPYHSCAFSLWIGLFLHNSKRNFSTCFHGRVPAKSSTSANLEQNAPSEWWSFTVCCTGCCFPEASATTRSIRTLRVERD